MRIGIQTWGSEGDIRPFLALGHALTKRGHHVELLYTEVHERRYEDVAASLGFTARGVASPVLKDDRQLVEIGLKALNTTNPLSQGLLISKTMLEPIVEPAYEEGLALCRRSDAVIQHFILHPARAAADVAGTPVATVAFAFMQTPSRYIHPPGTPRLGEWGNVIEWKIASLALNTTLLKDVNRFRARVGLKPFRDLMTEAWASHHLNLLAASPALLDRPSDWPRWNQLSGFLELPVHGHEALSPDVDAFLNAGPAPVFMGFGSLMPASGTGHLEDTLDKFEGAVRIAGCRAIIQSEIIPSTALRAGRPSSDRVLFVKRTPHRLVFPRCAAVVHHGGAGTTHSTLRAGVPSIVVPHVSDQFAWAGMLQDLGVSPKAIRRVKLTSKALAARITETLSTPSMTTAAMAIAQKMKSDNGPQRAADLVEQNLIRRA